MQLFLSALFEGLVNGATLALISMGVALIWGIMNILSFSQGEFLMLGLYISFYANNFLKMDPIFALPLAMIIMFLVGVLTYKMLVSRALKGPVISQRMLTFALSMVLVNGAILVFSGKYWTINKLTVKGIIKLGIININLQELVPLITSLIVTIALFYFLNRTKTGKAMRATALNRVAAELVGINTERSFMLAFGIAAAMAGAAGCALSYLYSINPYAGAPFLLFGFIAVALGGFGSIMGALLGGLMMGYTDVLCGVYLNPAFKYLAVSVMFMLVVYFKPKGLFGR